MGLFDLISNTVEGALEVTVNTAKTAVGVAAFPLDEGATMEDGVEGVKNGIEKIGKSNKSD